MPRHSPRRAVSLSLFIALYATATLVLYQGVLLDWLLTTIDPMTGDGAAILATLGALQIILLALMLLALGLVSIWLMKLVAATLFVTNAAALYYMQLFGVVFDPTMIGNILNTNGNEAAGIFQWDAVVYGTLWGLIPAAVVLLIPVRRGRRLGVVAALAGVVVAAVAVVYAASSTWLWFDEHGRNVGPRVLPWSYVGNGLRYGAEYRRRNRVAHLLPDATVPPLADGQREIVVLVIGEASRSDHLAAFGYDRDTTPFTAERGVLAYPGGRSCATYTIGSVACILSHLGNAADVNDPWENLPSYLERAGIPALVRLNNTGTPPMLVARQAFAGDLRQCEGPCEGPTLDGDLLTGLSQELSDPAMPRQFVLLHLSGSHGPQYFQKYPPEFAVFQPVCETTLVDQCSSEALINAYDNSIRYTDWILAQVIDLLSSLPDTRVAVLYVADHGQSLGENGVYLHGLPNSFAPEEQRQVPLMVWVNDAFAQAHDLDRAAMAHPIQNPQDRIFHSVLGAFNLDSPVYRPEYDVFHALVPEVQP